MSEFATIDDKAQQQRVAGYENYIEEAVAQESEPMLTKMLDHVLGETVPLVVARPVLAHFATMLANLKNATLKPVAIHALDLLSRRVQSFEEQDAAIRTLLSEVYVAHKNYYEAARTLQMIKVDGTRHVSDTDKFELFLRVVELYLMEDDTVTASTWLNHAAKVMFDADVDEALKLRYYVAHARILDSRRKFVDAAMKYYRMSLSPLVSEGDMVKLLTNAVTCAILSPAGTQRQRAMATLMRDSRIDLVEWLPILEKMYKQQFIDPKEVVDFAGTLAPHQTATAADGSTVLDRALIEHNIDAISLLYNNIRFDVLGRIVGVDSKKAEKCVFKMIEEKRLVGSIDQLNGLVEFAREAESLITWDAQIKDICVSVTDTVDAIAKAVPAMALK